MCKVSVNFGLKTSPAENMSVYENFEDVVTDESSRFILDGKTFVLNFQLAHFWRQRLRSHSG